jgi:hypothetical protein
MNPNQYQRLRLSGFISVQKGGAGGSTVKNNILWRTSNLLLDALPDGEHQRQRV